MWLKFRIRMEDCRAIFVVIILFKLNINLVNLKVTAFWDMIPCSFAVDRRFRGALLINLVGINAQTIHKIVLFLYQLTEIIHTQI
jgi:hypothetical protein